MGERLLCKQEVIGSIPFTSTKRRTADKNRFGRLGGIWRSAGCPAAGRVRWRTAAVWSGAD